MKGLTPVERIETLELFPPLSRELLAVLRSLQTEDWSRPTVCGDWTVKDVAAHLLGGNLGRLWNRSKTSRPADASQPGFDELVVLINQGNEEWVQAAGRISPEILVEFLELTDAHLYEYFKRLPPDDPARITVAWASDEIPPNWFDVAREYTEKWLHQQHIREAVGKPLLLVPESYHPVLDTFIRGFPRAYRQVAAADGTSVTVQICGPAGGVWTLLRENSRWVLYKGGNPGATSRVSLEEGLAWRLFTRGVLPAAARLQVQIEGDVRLGEKVLDTVSIMA